MSPGGSHGLVFTIFGLFGAGIVFGAAWLVTKILPFVDTVSFESTTGWVLCGVGGVAGCLLCQVALHGWREMLRSWVGWAMFVVPLYGLFAIVGWYVNANPDSTLVEAIIGLDKGTSESEKILLFISLPFLGFIIMCVVAIVKYNIDRKH